MTNRLIYDTAAGNLDEKGTFAQLIEYLRKAQEDAEGLARCAKMRNDDVKALMWGRTAQNFLKVRFIVANLCHDRTKSGVGYGRPN